MIPGTQDVIDRVVTISWSRAITASRRRPYVGWNVKTTHISEREGKECRNEKKKFFFGVVYFYLDTTFYLITYGGRNTFSMWKGYCCWWLPYQRLIYWLPDCFPPTRTHAPTESNFYIYLYTTLQFLISPESPPSFVTILIQVLCYF